MCHSHSLTPADLSPLSYGTGLALGLMLILGLLRAPAGSPVSRRAGLQPADLPPALQSATRYRPAISLVLRQVARDRLTGAGERGQVQASARSRC